MPLSARELQSHPDSFDIWSLWSSLSAQDTVRCQPFSQTKTRLTCSDTILSLLPRTTYINPKHSKVILSHRPQIKGPQATRPERQIFHKRRSILQCPIPTTTTLNIRILCIPQAHQEQQTRRIREYPRVPSGLKINQSDLCSTLSCVYHGLLAQKGVSSIGLTTDGEQTQV